MKFIGFFSLLFVLILSNPVFAQISNNSNEISIFASVCEKLINNESRSSARIRASDKASFKAVEEIPELSHYRDKMDAHRFNLNVYRLVDNYLEDMKINTVEQNSENVCVEISAYLSAGAIDEVFTSVGVDEVEIEAVPEIAEEVSLEVEDLEENVKIDIPPKPEIVINKKISYQEEAVSNEVIQTDKDEEKTIVFIDKTDFYNGSSTTGFFAHIEKELLHKSGIKAVAVLNTPDYILKTKVLKAKVDNVNSETGRLQIVVALELIDTKTSGSLTDHQNRFILFNSTEDTQKVAADLIRKLLTAGIEKLREKIKVPDFADNSKSVITPRRS